MLHFCKSHANTILTWRGNLPANVYTDAKLGRHSELAVFQKDLDKRIIRESNEGKWRIGVIRPFLLDDLRCGR